MKKLAFVGSFDPVTLGHVDIIQRASQLCDELHVLVASSYVKPYMFSLEQRLQFVKMSVSHISNVQIQSTEALTVDYLKKHNIKVLLRALRGVKDFDYEDSIASVNKVLFNDLEVIVLFANPKYRFLSSSYVKELITQGADLSLFLPSEILNLLKSGIGKL